MTDRDKDKQMFAMTETMMTELAENFLHYDFQGWPVYKKTLKEILLGIGATEKDGVIGFASDDPILDIFPETVIDDGMAYLCEEMYFASAWRSNDGKHTYLERDYNSGGDQKAAEEGTE